MSRLTRCFVFAALLGAVPALAQVTVTVPAPPMPSVRVVVPAPVVVHPAPVVVQPAPVVVEHRTVIVQPVKSNRGKHKGHRK